MFAVACKGRKEKEAPKQQGSSQQPVVVDVIIAQAQEVSSRVEANGTVVANEYVELRTEISGRLVYLNVPEGSYVQKGTVIAKINDADYVAGLAKSRAQLELAQKTEQRLKKLIDIGGLNQADYDVAVNQVSTLKADIGFTQAQIDKTVIRAPFGGLVGLRQVSLGAYLSPTTIIATIQQVDRPKIDFTIPEEYSELIHKGAAVDVQLDANSKSMSRAVIIATEPQVIQNTRNLKIRAVLQSGKVNPGAFVKVTVAANRSGKAIFVPTNAIIPDDKNKQLVLVKAGKAAFVNVETGDRQANNAEITKGISVGDSVVVTGVLFARPKAPLKVRSVKTLEQLNN
ncbi:efflux RND transporter periplasmic adaptor subunit [Sediminibacterium sp. WSJ-3]|nr:efflux RND transporter periplasmic adaptor subunit [Sediminibacterium soli]